MNYIQLLIPRPLRQAVYDKFLDELQRIEARGRRDAAGRREAGRAPRARALAYSSRNEPKILSMIEQTQEPITADEQRAELWARSTCPVLLVLEALCEDVRTLRDSGSAVEIVRPPYRDSLGQWRATVILEGVARGMLWCELMNWWKIPK